MSAFDLNTSGQLPAVNEGVSQLRFDKYITTRNAIGDNFSQGPVEFRFSMAGNRWLGNKKRNGTRGLHWK